MTPLTRVLLLPLLILVACQGAPTPGQTPPTTPQPPAVTPVGPGEAWSDPGNWGGGLPNATSSVVIPAGKRIVLDGNVTVKSLTVNGTLEFARKDLELKAGFIMVMGGGAFKIGSELQPFTQRATITLTGGNTGANNMGMGEKFLGAMGGGSLEFYGESRTGWTHLTQTANKGATQLTLEGNSNWRVGDTLKLASTDFDMNQAESLTVTSVNGNTVTFTPALKYTHFGQVQSFNNLAVDSRAEVALLNRSIKIQGDDSSLASGFGGHMMIMDRASKAKLQDVEITRMGQEGILKRYALHFHQLFDDGQNSFVKNSSIHDTFNRCLVVHGTNKLLVQRNSCVDNIGHAFFLEDGAEVENKFIENLGMLTRVPKSGKAVIPADADSPATFWITNPRNTFTGNVAAGSDGFGYWFALPQDKIGVTAATNPSEYKTLPFQEEWKFDFSGNTAHSSGTGLFEDGCVLPDFSTTACYFGGSARAKGTELGFVPKASDPRTFLDITTGTFTAYKNKLGVWNRGTNQRYNDVRLADNGDGMILACFDCEVVGGVIAGETANKGNPKPGERTGPFGHSLPNPNVRDFDQTLVGYRFYEGPIKLKNLTFANFNPGKLSDGADRRQVSAISFNTGLHSGNANTTEKLRFIGMPDSNRVSMFGGEQFNFRDLDGSLAGQPSAVVEGNDALVDSGCTARADWGMDVCPTGSGTLASKYRFMDVSNGFDNPITKVTRVGGGSYASGYLRYNAAFDATQTNRFDFQSVPTPGTELQFFGHLPGNAWRFEMLFSGTPNKLNFSGGIPPVVDQDNIVLQSVSSLGAMRANTYYFDASAKVLHVWAVPAYKDYVASNITVNLEIH